MDFRRVRQELVTVPSTSAPFTLSEWYLNNRRQYRTAEDQQQVAERVIAKSDLLCDLISDATKYNKAEVDKKLEERIKDTEYHKKENEIKKKECCKEEEVLLTYRRRIMDALESLKEQAMKICKKCIILRKGRLGIDLVHDDVARELLKEVQTIEGVQSLLHQTLEQAKEQIRLLRSAKYFLDRDNEDKANALKIDKHCISLQETSLNLSMYHGTESLDPVNVTKEEWALFSNKLNERATKEVNNARPLHSYIDILLKQVTEDLWNQFNVTNEAFRRRISETREVKLKLENEHHETLRQINKMMRNITRLEKAIAEKEGFIALAHSRLGHRAQRSASERTRDEVQTRLLSEVRELRDNVTALQDMLSEAQASLRYLLKTQIQLEEDINVKANTLKIDEVDCMPLRESMDYHFY
ncbi:tektin-1 isoform X2 [Zootermopsis nevadensis]|uniref:Tektin n=2 Tax=Zootermopsis nevadensis TaxID=136037 RepID=A0A067RKP2_ZOONE|nr:tektin-1 isoform X2 [Zootermopsis nevadensis]XP_021918693.1 tektin-1 isoform X2 [Zootermopsis nevadensis]XP_021918695.1 tektin-1 isoform X2 [Zootermopsis nevadensis]XP_021918696.1 tektin-1 isoform X2 [Zootermopsis nevadensis]XP_021918697.1 tektin-1 isoform X2 [Zootermopsis nevadensis]KDR20069.1 Tektin-1 [Zootermopsis nevadensis]